MDQINTEPNQTPTNPAPPAAVAGPPPLRVGGRVLAFLLILWLPLLNSAAGFWMSAYGTRKLGFQWMDDVVPVAIVLGITLLFWLISEAWLGRRMPLLKGFGRANLLLAWVALVFGLFKLAEAPFRYPGYWDWIPHLFILAGTVWLLWRAAPKMRIDHFERGKIWITLLLAVLISLAFPFFGGLGSGQEIILAGFEALSFATVLATIVWVTFAFVPQFINRHPIGSRIIARAVWLTGGFVLFSGRGIVEQGVFGIVLIICSMFLVGHIVIWPKIQNRSLAWRPLFLYGFVVIAIYYSASTRSSWLL